MQAIILAAGQGKRLRPLTDHRPKCLVLVQGKPMLQYELEALDEAGLRKCVIVVGHRSDQVRARFGTRFRNLSISYVENNIFGRTNNIYSLWLARHDITDDLLLLEGDLLFDPRLLVDVIECPHADIAVVDRYDPSMNGTVILANGDTATAMVLKADQGPGFDYGIALKTVNIYKLSRRTVRDTLMPALDRYVSRGLTNHYYEAAIANAIAEHSLPLHLLLTGSRLWIEIDTKEDLRQAEQMHFWPAFASGPSRLQSAVQGAARASDNA